MVFNDDVDFKTELTSILKNTFKENYNEYQEESFEPYIRIKYKQQIADYKHLIGFEVSIEEKEIEVEQIINGFNENLKKSEKIYLVLKFYDDTFYNLMSELYKMLYSVEIILREAISIIFIDTYKSDYYNLLKQIDINPQYNGKNNLRRDKSQRQGFLSKRLENEFFYLLFSDYTKISKPKILHQDDLYTIAELSNNFDEFKDKIVNRGIIKEEYLTFIENIKPVMDNLERIRNCVAHNRSLSEEDQRNYKTYFDELNKHINGFLDTFSLKEKDTVE